MSESAEPTTRTVEGFLLLPETRESLLTFSHIKGALAGNIIITLNQGSVTAVGMDSINTGRNVLRLKGLSGQTADSAGTTLVVPAYAAA